ncbi:pilus assembly PilX N-terminal domain-containing protein [Caldifermentibacillus hisashii]|uniref:pilus assembly PilX N-terminal domain-containing protein n=1 Tax=Caldifermentibacillus hisashii TaxID=996558 RepID=UPI003D1A7783
MKKYLNRLIKNDTGGALVFVILLFTLFSILGISLVTTSISNVSMSTKASQYQSAYYIAESGLVMAMDDLTTAVKTIGTVKEEKFNEEIENLIDSFGNKEYSAETFKPIPGIQPKAVVTIKKNEDSTYTIKSVGEIGNNKRTLIKQFRIQWSGGEYIEEPDDNSNPQPNIVLPDNLAVLTNGKIEMSGGASVVGNVATTVNKSKNPIILSGGANINGTVSYSEQRYDFHLPSFPLYPVYSTYPNKSWNNYDVVNNGDVRIDSWLANNYTLDLTDNASFDDIKITSNWTLYIDVGSTNKSIVVNNLNIENGHIKLKGTGKLTIYLKGNITMGAGSTINEMGNINTNELINKLTVYVDKSSNPSKPKEIKLAGAQKIYGSLFAIDADIDIAGGGGFQGHIFTGGSTVSISGGGSGNPSYIYAPNADIKLSGGGIVKGTIVGKTLDASGGTSVTYQYIDLTKIPFVQNNQAPPNKVEVGGGIILVDGAVVEK